MNSIPLTYEKIATFSADMLNIQILMKKQDIQTFEERLSSLHEKGKHDCNGALELSKFILRFKNELTMLQNTLDCISNSSSEDHIVFHEGWALCPF